MCVNSGRSIIRSSDPISNTANFEAKWNANGEVFLKVDGKLVGKAEPGILKREPDNTILIGADLHQPVGDYKTPNHFAGKIENLTFKYPNGT